MITLQDIINELMKIREAVNALEVKGNQNAALVCYAYTHCEELIKALNNAIEEIQKQNQNGNETVPEPELIITEVGEEIGQDNTNPA